MGIPDDNAFMALARHRFGHLFPYLPKQPGYNKRLRAVAPTVARVITHVAIASPSFCAGLRLLTPRRCRAANRAKPPAAPSSLATPATAAARSTAGSRSRWGLGLDQRGG
jgi:hypothetical protein